MNAKNETGLLAFLRNKKLFRCLAALYAIVCTAGCVLLTKADLSIPNTLCLAVLGGLYIFLYLTCYFRGHCERGLAAGQIRPLHAVIAVLLSVGILLVCGLDVHAMRENSERLYALREQDSFTFSAGISPEAGTDSIVVVRGIVTEGKDYNLYEVPLTEPWYFSEEGFIVARGEPAETVMIPISPAKVETIYVRTRPDGGILRLQAGEYSGEWDLYAPQEKEIPLDTGMLTKAEAEGEKPFLLQLLLWIIAAPLLAGLLLPLTVHAEQLISRSFGRDRRQEAEPNSKKTEEQGGPAA